MNHSDRFVDILVDSGFKEPLTYFDTSGELNAGDLLKVPYKNQMVFGIVLRTQVPKPGIAMDKIRRITSENSVPLPADLFQSIRTLKNYYFSSAREIMRTVRQPITAFWEFQTTFKVARPLSNPTPLEQKVIEAINGGSDQWQIEELSVRAKSTLKSLIDNGAVAPSTELKEPLYQPQSSEEQAVRLSEQQEVALTNLNERSDKPILFWGDTGSGKTVVLNEYYLTYRAQHGQWLILLPEIALLSQIEQRIAELSGKRVRTYHGSLTESAKKKVLKEVLRGEVDIVIGTRSAVFLPFAKLSLITVDECHDRSYKDAQSCRYNARDLAVLRASIGTIPIVLASATPDLESIEHTRSGKYSKVRLKERFGAGELASVDIVDISKEPQIQGLSVTLFRALEENLKKSRQSLIFINRKGFAPVFLCGDCGWMAQCPNCSARLAWFKDQQHLKCHACGYQTKVLQHCPECKMSNLIPMGLATERVEAILTERFPHARVLRVDRDSVRTQAQIEEAIDQIEQGNVDIIVSTQILAKAVNFEQLTFVAVLDIDQGLLSLDPRATEYTGQQVIQVLGRAGRFQSGASALIQTTQRERKELTFLHRQNWDEYSDYLLKERYLAALPPYAASLVIRGEHKKEQSIDTGFEAVYQLLVAEINELEWGEEISVTPPFAARIERVDHYYRRIIYVTARQRKTRNRLINKVASRLEKILPRKTYRWHIDVDPIELG